VLDLSDYLFVCLFVGLFVLGYMLDLFEYVLFEVLIV